MSELTFKIHTFGCKVNTYDTGLLQNRLTQDGFVNSKSPNVHVLNTCAVTAEATKEAIKTVRKLKAQDPFAKIIVTGCAAQVDTDKFSNLPGADLVIANSHKGKLEELVRGLFNGTTIQKVYKSNIFLKDDLEAGGGTESDHTRSFLKIQDGCNSFCTFCVIPFARGKSRSIPINDLVRRAITLCDNDVREIVLTGVHIGDYEDGPSRLEDLVQAILTRTKISRIRLSSLEPIEVTSRLLDLYQDPRMCPHFHMSIQSANTKVLSEMKRKYTSAEVESALKNISKIPEVFVGMDVIAGFPGESTKEFQDTFDRLQALPWTKLHVFPYSLRPGTKAAKIEGHLERSLVKERAKKLNALSRERLLTRAIDQIGTVKKALGLKSTGAVNLANTHTNRALSHDYWNLHLKDGISVGTEVAVKVIGHAGFDTQLGNPYLTAETL